MVTTVIHGGAELRVEHVVVCGMASGLLLSPMLHVARRAPERAKVEWVAKSAVTDFAVVDCAFTAPCVLRPMTTSSNANAARAAVDLDVSVHYLSLSWVFGP